MSSQPVTIRTLVGHAIAPYLDDIARLRINVFREWPYLYEGDTAHETEHLKNHFRSPRSVAVLAIDGNEVVGASTGAPLAEESEAFLKPFVAASYPPAEVFYCGESVLLPRYRGSGLGHRFFDEREAHARALGGFAWTALCSVDRDADHPRHPSDCRGNDVFWTKRGYRRNNDLKIALPWAGVGADGDAAHTLTCWMRPLEKFW